MIEIDSMYLVIGGALIIIVSYLFNLIAKKTNIPSVLMLIGLGVGLNFYVSSIGFNVQKLFPIMEAMGVVGVIMIVLEAALDLKLDKSKVNVLVRSFAISLIILVVTSLFVAFTLSFFLAMTPYKAMVYGIPMSIMSSAIIIPSVSNLPKDKREFMVYESTFSDILGIMLFYFFVDSFGNQGAGEVAWGVTSTIFLTLLAAVVLGYLLIILFQYIRTHEKLFLMIALLVLLYAVGKLFHLSSLLIIFFFGLMLNNKKVFFKGKLKKLIYPNIFEKLQEDFTIVIVESSFIVRTFFFVLFGMSIKMEALGNPMTYVITGIILLILYSIRYINLKLISKAEIFPELFIAPRGLITILLFYAIPAKLQSDNFNVDILLMVIIITSLIMMFGLMGSEKGMPETSQIDLEGSEFDPVDKEEALIDIVKAPDGKRDDENENKTSQ